MKVIELTLREAVSDVVGFFAVYDGEFSIWTIVNCIRKDLSSGKYTLVVKPDIDIDGIITSAKGLNVEALLESLEGGVYDTGEVTPFDTDKLSAGVREELPAVLEAGADVGVTFDSRFETKGTDTFRVYFTTDVDEEELEECCEGVKPECSHGCCLDQD